MTTRSEITWLKRRRKYSGSGHNMNHHHGGLQDSPLVVGLLGVMAGSLIVAILHCFIVCRCNDNIPRATRMTTGTGTGTARAPTTSQRQNVGAQDYAEQASTSSSGSFSSVQVIVTSNYTNRESIDEICAVCLSEFNQGDEVRVLPECAHTFHVPCIDKWLHSHRNCPLCRAETLPSPRDVVPSLPHPAGVPVSSSELYRIPDLSA